MPTVRKSFRIGRVKGYLRGTVWYLCYHENGRRRRPRIGTDCTAARRLAAQTNAQLETGAAPMLSFQPLSVAELRERWLDHHEHVLRSSVHTINRYRTATEHLLNFLRDERPVRVASQLSARDAEAFVQYLRKIEVAPNGHKNTAKRRLLDKGIKYILESCRALFTYAGKRRHLPPYAENPFSAIEIDRIPVENAKAIVLLTAEQERQFLEACDDWQFPLFRMEFIHVAQKVGLSHLTMPKVLRHQFATALQDGRVDPLIRNQLMGHAPADQARPGAGLGMTAVYTHSRPETVRGQLELALRNRPALARELAKRCRKSLSVAWGRQFRRAASPRNSSSIRS